MVDSGASYSPDGTDILLHEYFGGLTRGFYVDVGAGDGLSGSGSLAFDKLGWSGICIEPTPVLFRQLQVNRPNATALLGRCVTGNARFPTSGEAVDGGFRQQLRQTYRRFLNACYAAGINRGRLLLETVLEQYSEGRRVNLIVIRGVSSPLDVLQGLRPARWGVEAFVVEIAEDKQFEQIVLYMRLRKYRLARRLETSLVFIRRGSAVAELKYFPLDSRGEPDRSGGATGKRGDRWIASNVLCQAPDQTLSSLMRWLPQREQICSKTIYHVVNLFPGEDGKMDPVQKTTVKSMLSARGDRDGEIKLVNVQESGGPDLTPEGFLRGPELTRTLADLGVGGLIRPLPLIFDILENVGELASDDDIVIYTNADICTMPHFYDSVLELLSYGFDAITVNRRTIASLGTYPEDSSLRLIDVGLNHPGYDCFVFRAGLIRTMVRNNACIGVAGVAQGLLYNMVARAERLLMLTNVAMTYHYGDDMPWATAAMAAYTRYNEREYQACLRELLRDPIARVKLVDYLEGSNAPHSARRVLQE